jgi:hypothetical protein
MIVNKAMKKFGFFKSLCKYGDELTFLKLYFKFLNLYSSDNRIKFDLLGTK